MLFVCHPIILHKLCLQFLLGVMQNFGLTKKEYYGMLWYFLEWSTQRGVIKIYKDKLFIGDSYVNTDAVKQFRNCVSGWQSFLEFLEPRRTYPDII